MFIFVTLFGFVFSFIILYFSRLWLTGNRVSAGGDTFFHLLISESIRKNRWAYPSSLQNVTFDEGEKKYNYLAYPPMLHYVTALFPANSYLKVSKILNLVLLSFLSAVTALFVYTLTLNFAVALFASFIVLFNMAVFELEVLFTPRPLGLLFYSLLMFIVVFYPQSSLLILATTILVSLVILTHKFATQLLVFTLVPYALVFNELFLFLPLGFGFLLSILVTRGAYLKIFKEHVGWLYFYSHFAYRGPLAYKLRRVFVRNFWYLAVFISIIFILVQGNQFFLMDNLILKLFFWALLPFIVAMLVVLPNLSFLGEDYRYIEYSIAPVGIICALSLATLNIYVLLALSVCFIASVAAFIKYKSHLCHSKELLDPDDILAYQTLKNYSLNNLLVFPPTRTLEVNFFTKLNVIHPVRAKDSTLTDHLKGLLNKYNFKYVLRFKGVDPYQRFSTLANMVHLKSVLTLNSFELFELPSNEVNGCFDFEN